MILNYCKIDSNKLITLPSEEEAPTSATHVVKTFQAMIQCDTYTCLGAKKTEQENNLRFGVFDSDCDRDIGQLITAGLQQFEDDRNNLSKIYASYIAIFPNWAPQTEVDFENSMWQRLQQVHDYDYRKDRPWDESKSTDSMDPNFGFSVNGKAYFIVGLHPNSSRWARRFPWPTLVFNSHSQFELLYFQNSFDKLKLANR
jgi:FPC/CPF motif-containing protein YcgG